MWVSLWRIIRISNHHHHSVSHPQDSTLFHRINGNLRYPQSTSWCSKNVQLNKRCLVRVHLCIVHFIYSNKFHVLIWFAAALLLLMMIKAIRMDWELYCGVVWSKETIRDIIGTFEIISLFFVSPRNHYCTLLRTLFQSIWSAKVRGSENKIRHWSDTQSANPIPHSHNFLVERLRVLLISDRRLANVVLIFQLLQYHDLRKIWFHLDWLDNLLLPANIHPRFSCWSLQFTFRLEPNIVS